MQYQVYVNNTLFETFTSNVGYNLAAINDDILSSIENGLFVVADISTLTIEVRPQWN